MANENIFNKIDEVGKAKESGWQHHYSSISKIKDECSKFGTLARQGGKGSIEYLKAYLNHVFTFGQNLFCFYDQGTEDSLTSDYLKLVTKVNIFIEDVNEGFAKYDTIPEDLTMDIAKYFNSLMRLAKNAGLLIDQEELGSKEPQKGELGLR